MKTLYPVSMVSHESFRVMFLVCAGAMAAGVVLYACTRESLSGSPAEESGGR